MSLNSEDIAILVWAVGNEDRRRGETWDSIGPERRNAIVDAVEFVLDFPDANVDEYHQAYMDSLDATDDGPRSEDSYRRDRVAIALIKEAAKL